MHMQISSWTDQLLPVVIYILWMLSPKGLDFICIQVNVYSNAYSCLSSLDKVPPLKVIDRAIFSWNVDKKHICDYSTVTSPTLSSKLSTFQCAMKKQQIHIDLFIVTKNKMDLATMLTSGM